MAHPSLPRRGSLNTGGLDEGGGSVPGPQHPQQHVHQQQQQQPSSQSLHMPTKKKSGFQITSVTAAQPNSVAEDTESYDDLDESRTEDISSEILDGSRNADFEPGAYERSSSEETLNNVGEGVDTPALTPVHAQGGVFMVNGGPHLGPANAAQGHAAAANLTAPTRLAPSPAAASTAAAPPSSQTVAGPAVAAAFSAPAQPGVASPRAAAAAAAAPPATPPPAAQAMAPAPVSVATAPSSQVAPSNPLQQQQPHPPHHHHHHHLPVCSSRFRVVKLDTTTEPYKKGRWTCTEYYEKESASLAADASAAASAAVAASVAAAAAARNNVNDSMKESGAPTLVAASYNAVDAASGAALVRVNSLDYGSQQGGINAVNSGVPAAFNKQQGNTVGHNIQQQQQLSNVNAFVQSAGGQGSIQTVGMQQVVSASTQPQPSQQPQKMSYAGQQQIGVQPQGQAMGGSALTQGPLTVTQMPGPVQTGEGKAATMASSQLGGQHPQSTPAVPQPQASGQPTQPIAHQVIHNPAATQQSYIAHQGSVTPQVTHQQPQPGQPLGQQTLLGQQQQVVQQPQPIGQQAQQMGQASMQPQLGQQQQQPGGQQAQMGAQAQQKGQQTQMGQQALQVGQQSQQPQQVGQQPPVMMVGQQLAQQLSQHNPPQSPQVVQQNPMMPQQPPQSPSLVQQQQATSQQLFQQQTPHPIAQQAFPQQSMPTHGLSEQQQAINQHNFQQQLPLTQQAQPMTPQQAFSQQPPMQAHVLLEQQQQAVSQPAFQQQQPPMLSDQQSMQQPQASQSVGPPGPVLQPQQQQHAQLAVQPPQQQQHGLLPLQQILPVSGLASGAPIGGAAPQPLPVGLQHPLTLGGDLGGYGGSFLPQAAASLLLQHGQQQLSHQQSQALLSLAYSVAQTQHQLPGSHPEDPSGAAAHGEVHGEGFAGGIPVIPQLLPMAVGATQGLLESEEESASGASVVAIDNKIEQAMDLVKSHLMYAVREEVEVLKEQIKELIEKNSQLEQENRLLKSLASPEQLQQIQSQIVSVPSGGGGAQPSTPGGGTPAVCAAAAPPAAAAPVTTAPTATALPTV